MLGQMATGGLIHPKMWLVPLAARAHSQNEISLRTSYITTSVASAEKTTARQGGKADTGNKKFQLDKVVAICTSS